MTEKAEGLFGVDQERSTARTESHALIPRAAIAWIAGDDTGLSSRAIWAHMVGTDGDDHYGFGTEPSDPDDFGRCYRLLRLIPEWRSRITEMASEGTGWARLVPAWDELTALYEQEAGDFVNRRSGGWRAPLLYARMKELERGKRDRS